MSTPLCWLLRVAVGGGLVLLLARLLLARTHEPARRQRLGEWAVAAALAVALLSLAPAWLVIPLPAARQAPAPVASPPALPAVAEEAVEAPAVIVPAFIVSAEPVVAAEPPAPAAPAEPLRHIERSTSPAPPEPAPALPLRVEPAQVVLFLYVAGALLLLLRWLLGHFALWRLLRNQERVPRAAARLFAEMTLGQRGVRLRVARHVRVPFSYGLLRPTVVLPAALAEEAPPEILRWVLAHELSHLERRDAWANLLFGLAQLIYYFLPWFWWLRRHVRLSQEYLADAAAVAAGGNPADYAQLLIGWTAAPALPATATGVSGQSSDLYRRVTMLLQGPVPTEPRCPRRWSLTAALGLFALAAFVAGLGLSGQAAHAQGKAVDAPKKTVDAPKKTEPREEEEKKKEPAREEDPRLEEMLKRLPANLTPEQREQARRQMVEFLKRQKEIGAGRFPNFPGGGIMPPGFAPFGGGGMMEPRLGARLAPPSATLVDQLDLPRGQGMVIESVRASSAAAKAGLKAHDILLELDGKAVPSKMQELPRMLNGIKADKAIEAVVLRKGKKETIKDLSLPEAKAGFPGFPGGAPGFPGGAPGFPNNPPNFNPPGGGNPPPGFPPPGFNPPNVNPPGGFPGGPPGGNTVMTTTYRSSDRFTTRHQEGSLVITITGKVDDGKAVVSEIRVQDGREADTYKAVDKVPERYRDKVKSLVQALERGPKVEIKSR